MLFQGRVSFHSDEYYKTDLSICLILASHTLPALLLPDEYKVWINLLSKTDSLQRSELCAPSTSGREHTLPLSSHSHAQAPLHAHSPGRGASRTPALPPQHQHQENAPAKSHASASGSSKRRGRLGKRCRAMHVNAATAEVGL